MKHTPIVGGLIYLIRILPKRGGSVIGLLEEDGEIIFEDEFPSYKDAYWALMHIDRQEFLSRAKNGQATFFRDI